MARPSNREKILDAYVALLVDQGASAATLDAVCDLAGVSKGGLLYHFPSKSDLQAGVFDRLEKVVDAFNASAPDEPVELIRWYLSTADDADPAEDALWRSLFATIHLHEDDGGISPAGRLSELVARYSERLAALDPTLGAMVRLIGDGIYFNRLSGGPPLDDPTREAIVRHLAAQIRDADEDRPSG